MAHTSAATYLTWSILCTVLGAFLVFHLWNFDRFRCLKWNNGPHSGAFKRIMTYTYLVTIPCIGAFAMGFSIIKYQAGYSFVPGAGIIPTPWQLWPEAHKRAIFPLQLVFSIGWSLEMVTHLEGSVQRDWFRSLYFKTWIVGSCVAIIYMPLVTIFTRSDPLKCEAFSFLAGGLGSLSLTIWFTPILWSFPKFLNNLKREGVDMNTVVRLTTFYELNALRVIFRFLMVAPLIILGVDGVRSHHHINESNFWTDFLAIISGIGCVISSGITLVIFFPRSIQGEIEAKQASRQAKSQREFRISRPSDPIDSTTPQSPVMKDVTSLSDYRGQEALSMSRLSAEPPSPSKAALDPEASLTGTVMTFAPNRRLSTGGTVEGGVTVVNLTEQNLFRHNYRSGSVHPFVHNFTSPIDLMQGRGHSYGQVGPYGPRGPRQHR
ncbi:unnamed protein product [Somion occarium]|uniref:Uncharacterized protein n=1 Tax=Somion occarium TaxID=3059160 RepID=A0ABP1DUD1_9APHY